MTDDNDAPQTTLNARRLAREYGTKTALQCAEASLSYEELAFRTDRHRDELSGTSGPCAIVATSDLEAIVVLFACLTFRRPVLLVPPNLPPGMTLSLLERTGATHCFSEGKLSRHSAPPSAELPQKGDDVLLPTSGTTGFPKIVCLSQGSLLASAAAVNVLVGLNRESRWALTLPYAHVGGLAVLVRSALAGAAVVVKDYPLRTRRSLAELDCDSVTHLSLVPTQLQRALETRARCPSSLKAVLVGGASCPPGLRARARQAGWPVSFTYGFTEAASQVCTQKLRRDPEVTMERDVGRPLPGMEVALDGSGRISVRGRPLMNRYWGSPARAGEDWFVTQDFGHWDEADRLVIRGRADNMIISGGENVAAERVEDGLLALPGVSEAAVFGVADGEWGQRITALVVGVRRTLEAMRTELKQHLESYALPKEIHFCSALPRLQSGKLDRESARAMLHQLSEATPIDQGEDGGRVRS
jgi:O-succinylbenzoic acid--CoA ligase